MPDHLYDFNMARSTELDKRNALLREMFAEIGKHDREYYFKDKKIDWDAIE